MLLALLALTGWGNYLWYQFPDVQKMRAELLLYMVDMQCSDRGTCMFTYPKICDEEYIMSHRQLDAQQSCRERQSSTSFVEQDVASNLTCDPRVLMTLNRLITDEDRCAKHRSRLHAVIPEWSDHLISRFNRAEAASRSESPIDVDLEKATRYVITWKHPSYIRD